MLVSAETSYNGPFEQTGLIGDWLFRSRVVILAQVVLTDIQLLSWRFVVPKEQKPQYTNLSFQNKRRNSAGVHRERERERPVDAHGPVIMRTPWAENCPLLGIRRGLKDHDA